MDRRKLLMLGAALLALLGTGLVYLYANGAGDRASKEYNAIPVLVAKEKINSGESFSAAQAAGKIETKNLVEGSLATGYVTSTEEISAADVAQQNIYPGEPILVSKFGASIGATALPIPKGMIAISRELTAPDRVAGFVNPGAEVVVYSTSNTASRVVLPRVTVLAVGDTTTVSTTTTNARGQQTIEEVPRTLLTLAVSPRDAQRIFLSSKLTTLSFGLLGDGAKVKKKLPQTTTGNLYR